MVVGDFLIIIMSMSLDVFVFLRKLPAIVVLYVGVLNSSKCWIDWMFSCLIFVWGLEVIHICVSSGRRMKYFFSFS